ncbi:hypothetical protein PRJ39_06650 [Lysobacter enzymogenes]|uniref:hypothetical protein n=1 Tax=Lysobacter enzymogenes TaxID=69 RepID=UPI003749479B
MAKLGVQTDIALARLAMGCGLIPPAGGGAFRSNRAGWLSLTSTFEEDRGCRQVFVVIRMEGVSGIDLAKSRSML